MGIFGALTTSVAGLRAQSYALENISGNIANSQTTAFKRIDTSFLDLIPDTGTTSQLAGSVTSASRETNTVQGDVQAAAVATYMAINGDGFFAVQKPGSFTDNNPVFDGVDRYTRRGDFTLDKNGYLVNGAGYYLEGIPIDPTTGNVTGSVPTVLKFGNDFLPAQPTTTVTYRANLASYPLTTKHDTSVPGSELLNVGDFTANPLIVGTPAQPYINGSKNGSVQNSKLTTATQITSATLLSGATNTDSIATDFTAGNTITVNGKPIAFYDSSTLPPTSAGAVPGTTYLDLATTTVGNLLTNIDTLTGTTAASSVSGGATSKRQPRSISPPIRSRANQPSPAKSSHISRSSVRRFFSSGARPRERSSMASVAPSPSANAGSAFQSSGTSDCRGSTRTALSADVTRSAGAAS